MNQEDKCDRCGKSTKTLKNKLGDRLCGKCLEEARDNQEDFDTEEFKHDTEQERA